MPFRQRFRPSQTTIMYTNAVYYPGQTAYSGTTPAGLNYACINLVYYAFAKVTETGHVFLGDEYIDAQMACDGVQGVLGSFLHIQQEQTHLQIVISIGGPEYTSTFAAIAANPVYRDNFAQSVYGLVEASGVDGVDVCWTFPANEQQATDLALLLAQVRMYIGQDTYLTTTMGASREHLGMYDLPTIASLVDLINLAAYDFYGFWSPTSGHHAQLYAMTTDQASGASAIHYLVTHGVPSKKILLGIPLYGRSFVGPKISGAHQPFTAVAGSTDGIFEYYSLPRPGAVEQIDKRVVGAQCVGGDGGFVSYDSAETVREKGEFARQKMLGGLFYWSAPCDSQDTKRSLVVSGFRALHGTPSLS
ncbi:hypothetical protein SEPCBS119000_004660 [Sporothrix epigloea]|uniref:chitinase n=1 Tax=Sporothrix epigloea TaxID=1892477 RepID=A0ABP0DVA3_9PEZI